MSDEFFTDDRTVGVEGAIELPDAGFESFLFDRDDPLLARYRGLRYDAYAAERVSPSFVQDLLADWQVLYDEPFAGVTADGVRIEGLYALPAGDSSAPEPRAAAEALISILSDPERRALAYPLDAREWRAWSNPEFIIHPVGLRLEDLPDASVAAVHDLLRASLSTEGYSLVRELMDLNGYLGELTDLPTVMNQLSYSIAVFGDPADESPWGWQLFGHHVAINFVSVGGRQVITPVFLGAEPAAPIDGQPPVFSARVALALELAASFTPQQRTNAVVYESVLDPAMPDGRLHPADERHVAGAFRDNRVIPYEGLSAATLSASQWALLRRILEDDLVLLQKEQRNLTLADINAHRDDTHLSWYGATDGNQPFYLRIQSPVILTELDHHAGVWLTNSLPARFHIHTTLRLPNGNDYGRAYIDQWRASHGGSATGDDWS